MEVYPNELLGSQTDMVQLTQTGAIDYCVASNAILETFSKNYEILLIDILKIQSDYSCDISKPEMVIIKKQILR